MLISIISFCNFYVIFSVVSFSGFGIRVLVASLNEFGSVPSSAVDWKKFISCLKSIRDGNSIGITKIVTDFFSF